jgi:hypothetical protein
MLLACAAAAWVDSRDPWMPSWSPTMIVTARGAVVIALALLGCRPEATPPSTGPASTPPVAAPTPELAPAVAEPEPEPEPAPEPTTPKLVGCWEKNYGSPPDKSGLRPSLRDALRGCKGCETLRAGPKAADLHVEVIARLKKMEDALPEPAIDEPKLWVNSGLRDGPPEKSMHNQGLAVDAVICGLDTVGTAKALREAGFTCVIEYYDGEGKPCMMAHGDLRGTEWALGAYAKGGRKARTCPKRATSKGADCQNQAKGEWSYD